MSKTIVLAGANGVLGNLAAQTFAARRYNLALLGRDSSKLDALVKRLDAREKAAFFAVNLLDTEQVNQTAQAVAAAFGNIHALLHLVGGWAGGKTIPDSDASEFASMLNQHVWTTYNLLQAFTPQLVKHAASRVIIVSHPVAVRPSAKSALYAAAKSAQESLVLTLAEEYKETGLTANIIQVKSIGMGGKGTSPAEIVAALEYLLSAAADKVNGARIPLLPVAAH